MTYRLAFTEDPAEFLDVAGEHLAKDPVLNTVLATVATRSVAEDAAGNPRPAHPRWWVTVHDSEDRVVGVAMRTAPFTPYPLYVLPMPDEAAVLLAAALLDRGEDVPAANGALPAARVVADEVARRTGGTAEVAEHMRLFELEEVVDPPAPPGRLRVAISDDAELCLEWYQAFEAAASEQAGRPHRVGAGEHFDAAFVDGRIAEERIHLWETPGGDVVHLTAANVPAYGVVRVGPVYTPKEHRGFGYASAAVAAVSRQILESGHRPCLFTDQANPTSNRIYQAIGYEPVVDMANHEITTRERA
ncbi:GNAT family N-acetyltransferase [Nocardioides dilutus]